jgi:hypothetical protein
MQSQSGRSKGKTALSKIGNTSLRKALFMPASVAARYCTPIKLWAQQIQSRRPEFSKLQIRGAVMHKLIRIVFGVLKHRSPFDPTLDSTFFPVCQQRPYLRRIKNACRKELIKRSTAHRNCPKSSLSSRHSDRSPFSS